MGTGVILSFPGGERITEAEVSNAQPDTPLVTGEDPGDPPASRMEQIKNILDKLDKIRHLVTQGHVDGFVFIGQDPSTGYFLTEVCLDPAVNRTELFGFMGVLDTVKLEISESAAMAPSILLDGSIADPYLDEEEQ